ncbi:MAG: GDSL-type esterase/lipase family protein [Patescibacteria group bacterium]|nr:GDSL-type esterase/lipase family protein [Patescibacteria group bacterium]
MDKLILAFGDSVTKGFWDEKGGWVSRLDKFLSELFLDSNRESDFYEVYNLGIDGDNSRGTLARLEAETQARLSIFGDEKVQIVFLLETGVNDALYFNDSRKNSIPLEEYKQNLLKIIMIANKFNGAKAAFLSPLLVDDSKLDPCPWVKENASYKNSEIEKYYSSLKDLCLANKVSLIDNYADWIKIDYKSFLDIDGIHPNSLGHKKIFNSVRNFLKQEKII